MTDIIRFPIVYTEFLIALVFGLGLDTYKPFKPLLHKCYNFQNCHAYMIDYIDVIANGNFQKMAFSEALTQARCRRLQACQPSPIAIRVAIIDFYNKLQIYSG